MKRYNIFAIALTALMLVGCNSTEIPAHYKDSNHLPHIYPDVADITVPVNIAPITFEITQNTNHVVTRYSYGNDEIVCSGSKSMPDIDDWKQLTVKAKGQAITVEVFMDNKAGEWTRCKPFKINVSPDSIDPYISYRLISPSYVTYEELTLNQRCLENYDEQVMVDNMLCATEKDGQCVNCHNYQQYNPQRMQFHARQYHGGTVIAYDGKIKKINMKNDSLLSAGVYPSWHPWLKLIAYSTNNTGQSFHTRDLNKIEVLDTESDLIVYDIDRNEVMNVENDPNEMEIFPFWAPDGKTLYYCSAHFEYHDTISKDAEAIPRAQEIKYNIYKKSFDLKTRKFGPRQLVFDAAGMNKSATLPRLSPNGQYLMFTLGGWGCFHIWHRDADLWLMNLKTAQARPMDELNSKETESYHSWSSNGKWVIFSTRRDDAGYTRPYIAHIDANGHATKPFELPTADPDFHRQFMKSYNIPEFMKGPVTITPQTFADVLKTDGEPPVKMVKQLTK